MCDLPRLLALHSSAACISFPHSSSPIPRPWPASAARRLYLYRYIITLYIYRYRRAMGIGIGIYATTSNNRLLYTYIPVYICRYRQKRAPLMQQLPLLYNIFLFSFPTSTPRHTPAPWTTSLTADQRRPRRQKKKKKNEKKIITLWQRTERLNDHKKEKSPTGLRFSRDFFSSLSRAADCLIFPAPHRRG